MAVVPNEMLGDSLPSVFEFTAINPSSNITTDGYPVILIEPDSIVDRSMDLKNICVSEIIKKEIWYNEELETNNIFING